MGFALYFLVLGAASSPTVGLEKRCLRSQIELTIRLIAMSTSPSVDFFTRHEFLIRRLHSLSGLIPVGAYMTVHLLVNASILNGAGSFQTNVNLIHSLGKVLPLVEWAFIFLPIIFHAAFGVWIIKSGRSNVGQYKYASNWRYSLQRWTGMIAIVFIFMHVFHLHGWFHGDWWTKSVAEPLVWLSFVPITQLARWP